MGTCRATRFRQAHRLISTGWSAAAEYNVSCECGPLWRGRRQGLGTTTRVGHDHYLQLDGQQFLALNGGPVFTFSPAISLIVNCEAQEDVDRLCEQLSEGGALGPCGGLTDKYGVSWQIVPTVLSQMMLDTNAAKSDRVMQALIQMKKRDIKRLQQAYAQGRKQ